MDVLAAIKRLLSKPKPKAEVELEPTYNPCGICGGPVKIGIIYATPYGICLACHDCRQRGYKPPPTAPVSES